MGSATDPASQLFSHCVLLTACCLSGWQGLGEKARVRKPGFLQPLISSCTQPVCPIFIPSLRLGLMSPKHTYAHRSRNETWTEYAGLKCHLYPKRHQKLNLRPGRWTRKDIRAPYTSTHHQLWYGKERDGEHQQGDYRWEVGADTWETWILASFWPGLSIILRGLASPYLKSFLFWCPRGI